MTWGGRRPGAGAKRKSDRERAVTGVRGKARVLPHPNAGAPDTTPLPPDDVERPKGLTQEERAVWDELAPFALANGTLVKATALAFRMLCRNVVLERVMAVSLDRGGPNHRGLIQRVDAELLRFNLAPCGKPMYRAAVKETDKPALNPLTRFLHR